LERGLRKFDERGTEREGGTSTGTTTSIRVEAGRVGEIGERQSPSLGRAPAALGAKKADERTLPRLRATSKRRFTRGRKTKRRGEKGEPILDGEGAPSKNRSNNTGGEEGRLIGRGKAEAKWSERHRHRLIGASTAGRDQEVKNKSPGVRRMADNWKASSGSKIG